MGIVMKITEEEFKSLPTEWPKNEYNAFFREPVRFLEILEKYGSVAWLKNSQVKYIRMNIDTRDASFTLSDRDGNTISPMDVINAIREYIEWQNKGR
jgi:hypothetical protein